MTQATKNDEQWKLSHIYTYYFNNCCMLSGVVLYETQILAALIWSSMSMFFLTNKKTLFCIYCKYSGA